MCLQLVYQSYFIENLGSRCFSLIICLSLWLLVCIKNILYSSKFFCSWFHIYINCRTPKNHHDDHHKYQSDMPNILLLYCNPTNLPCSCIHLPWNSILIFSWQLSVLRSDWCQSILAWTTICLSPPIHDKIVSEIPTTMQIS